MKLFTAHWQIKLVALVLATALWVFSNDQARVERTLTVNVTNNAVHSLPDGWAVIEIEPRGFTIEVTGHVSMLDKSAAEIVPKLVVSAEALEQGHQLFSPITNTLLGLDSDTRIQRVHPEIVSGITVRFARMVDEHVPVEIPRLKDVPPGLETTIALDHTQVLVRGPHNEIEALRGQKIRFQPVSLANVDPKITQAVTEKLQLIPLPANVSLREQVSAIITVKPVIADRRVISVPIHFLVPKDFFRNYDVELSQSQITMTVNGPENLLNALKPDEDVSAYVNLRRALEPNVTQELPVSLLAPNWLSYDAATVRVTATLRADSAPAPELLPVPAPE
jgi:YbbR domain-containing protein